MPALKYWDGSAWQYVGGAPLIPAPVKGAYIYGGNTWASNSVYQQISAGTVLYDEQGAVTGGNSYTVPVGEDGNYCIEASIQFQNATAGTNAAVRLRKNGVPAGDLVRVLNTVAAVYPMASGSVTIACVAGDVLSLEVMHSDTASRALGWRFSIEKVEKLVGATGPAGPPGNSIEYAFIQPLSSGVAAALAGAGAWVALPLSLGTPVLNTPAGAFTQSGDGSLTVNEAGTYHVAASLAGTSWATANIRYITALGKGATAVAAGSAPIARADMNTVATSNNFPGPSLSGLVNCVAGDKIWALAYQQPSAGSGYVQHFSITRVGAGPEGPQGPPGSVPSLVAALPSSPVEGDEVYFDANPGQGVIWHLRYDASILDDSKWEFVGGPAIDGTDDAVVNTAVTHSVYQTTVAPTITVPVAGVYDIEWEGLCATAALAGNGIFISPQGAGISANDAHASFIQTPAAGVTAGTPYGRRRAALTTGTLALWQRSSAAGVGQVNSQRRRMWLRPVRLG